MLRPFMAGTGPQEVAPPTKAGTGGRRKHSSPAPAAGETGAISFLFRGQACNSDDSKNQGSIGRP